MVLIDQHTKQIMEECKVRACAAGLNVGVESLEYIVSNRDLLELSPKVMIPTLYDYWVNDIEVLREYAKYKVFPSNPYETVINSRPAISFYNDNNPDWMNIMIFYHVLGHIDMFQNNILFEKTWGDDFVGQALADKRLIASLRSEYGRWVDYAIEFSRGIDNITGYFSGLAQGNLPESILPSKKLTYYFDVFLQEVQRLQLHEIFNEIVRYNESVEANPEIGESVFFAEVILKYPEFEAKFDRYSEQNEKRPEDLLSFIRDNSPFLRNEKNAWMKSVMTIVRNTALYFSPQIRSKIINEGWASYWHDELFRSDDRIAGHEIGYAKLNAQVTSISRIGLNPYAIGLRLLQYVEYLANSGKLSYYYQRILDIEKREEFNSRTGKGKEALFEVRKYFSDFTLINTFVTQEFVDMFDLFVVGKRYNEERDTIEYYIKSRKAEDYKQMLLDSLYHPPAIEIDFNKTNDNNIRLVHKFEGKQLIKEFIPETLLGIEYMWGGQAELETTEIIPVHTGDDVEVYDYQKVVYTMKDRKINKVNL